MQTLLVMCAVVKMAEITVSAQKSSLADCTERVTLCCRALLDPKVSAMLKPTLLSKGKTAFNAFLKTSKDKEISESKKNEVTAPSVQADDLIHVRQLRSSAVSGGELDLDDGSDLARATEYTDGRALLSSELSHVYQLSGFADPVDAERL